ncbi:MAG: hypothetical protein HYR63_28095 [Proteobacteria bacterium]|nr:hypothetical protein [Pseudomonadota bacterium]MBI3497951.1 hypothetical protein [Pseudomonadota bacterium]
MRASFYACIAALALALATVLVLPFAVDWNRFRPALADAGSHWLGQPVRITGGVTIEFLPAPVISFSAVAIGASEENPLLTARLVRLKPVVAALLGGSFEMSSVTLIEPSLAVGGLAHGLAPNWPAGLARVAVEGGMILAAAKTGRPRAEKLAGAVVRDAPLGSFELVFTATVGDSAAELKGTLAPGEAGAAGLALRLATAAGNARFSGTLADGTGTPALSGRLALAASDPERFLGTLARLGGFEESAFAFLPKPFSMDAALHTLGDTVELAQLQAELAGVDIDGSLKASFGAAPSLDASIRITHLELEPLIDGWRRMARNGRFQLPRGLGANLELKVDSMPWRGGLMRQVQLAAALTDGEAVLRHLTAQLPGGSELSAFGTLIARGEAPRLDLDLDLNSDNLRLAMNWLGIDVSGAAPTRLRRASLSARLSLTPDEAQLSGVDLRVDSTRLRGGLTLLLEDPPAFGLRVALDRLNLDAYQSDVTAASFAWLTRLPKFDANLNFGADLLTLDGLSLRDLSIEAMVRGGEVTVQKARIADLAGASLVVTGTFTASASGPAADLGFELATSDPGQLLRLSGVGQLVAPERLGPIRATGHLAGPVERLALDAVLGAKGREASLAGTVAVAALGARGGPTIALKAASIEALAALVAE